MLIKFKKLLFQALFYVEFLKLLDIILCNINITVMAIERLPRQGKGDQIYVALVGFEKLFPIDPS